MSTTLHAMAIETFVSMLGNLAGVLEKGAEHAKAKNLEPAAFVNARLAPDMFTLLQQVQYACLYAKDATARLIGEEPPKAEPIEETIEALKARVQSTIEGLRAVPASAFAGAEDRDIVIPVQDAMQFEMKGTELLRDWSMPHFYFHFVTAYDILRHQGVEIGKRDYLASVGRHIRPRDAVRQA